MLDLFVHAYLHILCFCWFCTFVKLKLWQFYAFGLWCRARRNCLSGTSLQLFIINPTVCSSILSSGVAMRPFKIENWPADSQLYEAYDQFMLYLLDIAKFSSNTLVERNDNFICGNNCQPVKNNPLDGLISFFHTLQHLFGTQPIKNWKNLTVNRNSHVCTCSALLCLLLTHSQLW